MERIPAGVIVNADDLGVHPATNAGIASAYREGIVSSASVMVTMPHIDDAIARVIRPTGIPVGLHVALTQGTATASPARIPDLVTPDGAFRLSAGRLLLARDRSLLEQVRTEVEAQLARAVDLGLSLTHIDSHQHVHMNPAIFAVFEEVAPRFGVTRMRLSREPLMPGLLAVGFGDALARRNHVKWGLIRWMARGIRPRLATTESFFGLVHSGVMSGDVLRSLLEAVSPSQSVEICVHPGDPAPRGSGSFDGFMSSDWRSRERDALCDGGFADLMRRRGLALRSYAGVAK
jgi:predicted glycoside hydrolase/deacetylase ChbG (UPF0249 family)